ncbi:MAG: hypothetical protein LBV71_16075 [Prevotella sp.]|jgi:hypothetical protein|nr:hypothetical protein [Prevotella sp.]
MSNIITTDIATIVDSDKITLVNNPSFIQFIGNQGLNEKLDTLVIKFNGIMQPNDNFENLYYIGFTYTDNGILYNVKYVQTVDAEYAAQYNNIFYQGNTVVDTVRNLQQKLLDNNFLVNNFIISANNDLLSIKPKVGDASKAYTLSYITGYATTTDPHIEINGAITYITPSVISSGTEEVDNTIPTFTLTVNSFTSNDALPAAALLTFVENNSKNSYKIQGTTDKSLIDGNKNYFYLNSNPVITCNNLIQALLTVPFFKNNFILSVDGDEFSLVGKRNNPNFSFNVTYNPSFCSINNTQYTINNSNVLYNSQIELDIYKNNQYVTTVSKSYIDSDVWFDVNNILNRTMKSYPNCLFLPNNILDSGTTMKYNYNSKYIKNYDTQFINFSENKYVVDGFVRTLEPNDINSYIYSADEDVECNILTNKLDRIYNIGEDISANIIIEPNDDTSYTIGLLIKYYENNKLVNENIIDTDNGKDLISSIYVTADKILITDRTQFIDVVWVKIPNESPDDFYEISSYIRYKILRECNDSYGFMFLNKLGGWDIYYFNSDFNTEFKTEVTTSFKTLQPNYKLSDTYEKVEFKETEETFAIKSMVNKETAEWLKELSTSKYVYSLFDNNRYVIVQDFDLSISDKDLFEVTMKYTYSDTYNTILK